jgi:hypothetical protein
MTNTSAGSIQARFEQFCLDNPWILKRLIELADALRAKGIRRYGIRTLWEILRWEATTGVVRVAEDFKLNDHYTSRYVRLIIETRPDLSGMFEMRELRSE